MSGLYIATLVALVCSFLFDREKTAKGVKVGFKKLMKILPSYMKLLVLIAVILFFSDRLIVEYLGQSNRLLGMGTGLVLGAITIMPGFIAYPLAGVLVQKGVSYAVVAAFVTSLMMVGILTYTIEKEFLGAKAAIIRNTASLVIAAVIALSVGLIYGELP